MQNTGEFRFGGGVRLDQLPSPFFLVDCLGRVPTQILFSCVFPVQLYIFPVPISQISNNFICETNLEKKLWQILQYPVSIESGNLQLEQRKFPVLWQNLQIPCNFPDTEILCLFPCFPCAVGTLFRRQNILCAHHTTP